MAVLVTRPQPDDETTAASLRARGFEVLLAPMLRFEPVAFVDDEDSRYGAVIVTSANALRGIAPHLKASRLLGLPLFTVGEHTAEAARRAGFTKVVSADGNAGTLRDCVLAAAKTKELKKNDTLLYLAGGAAARGLRCIRGPPDRGGAALFPSQRARIPGGGAGGRRRNIGAGDPAMLHLLRGSLGGPRCRGDAGNGGGVAG